MRKKYEMSGACGILLLCGVLACTDNPSGPPPTNVPQPEIGTWWTTQRSDTTISVVDSANKSTRTTNRDSVYTYSEVTDSALVSGSKYYTVMTYDTAEDGSVFYSSHLFDYRDSALYYIIPEMSIPGLFSLDTSELLVLQLPMQTGDEWEITDDTVLMDTLFSGYGLQLGFHATVATAGTASVVSRTNYSFRDTTIPCHRVESVLSTEVVFVADSAIESEIVLALLGFDSVVAAGDTIQYTRTLHRERSLFNSGFAAALALHSSRYTYDTSYTSATATRDTLYRGERVTAYHRVSSSDITF